MLRGELDPRAANLFLRLSLGGRITLSSRAEFDRHTDSVGNLQFGFPVRLRLDYRPGDARAYCLSEGQWILVAEISRRLDRGEQRTPAPAAPPASDGEELSGHPPAGRPSADERPASAGGEHLFGPAPDGPPLAGIAIFAAHPSFPARAETDGFGLSWVVPEDTQ
jgi:hypothetical protein